MMGSGAGLRLHSVASGPGVTLATGAPQQLEHQPQLSSRCLRRPIWMMPNQHSSPATTLPLRILRHAFAAEQFMSSYQVQDWASVLQFYLLPRLRPQGCLFTSDAVTGWSPSREAPKLRDASHVMEKFPAILSFVTFHRIGR